MKIKITSFNMYLIGLIVICSTLSCKEPNKAYTKESIKPKKENSGNIKLINPTFIAELRGEVGKIIHVGERLISIERGAKNIGDSISYQFNNTHQLTLKQVYTNEGKLKEVTTYEYDSSKNIISMISKSLDGGNPFAISFFYNELHQITSSKTYSSFMNGNEIYLYDDLNYLIEKRSLDNHDSLLRTTNYEYDNKGNLVLVLTKSKNGDIITNDRFKYNNLNQCIEREHNGEPINCSGRNKWQIRYNGFGDVIEEQTSDLTVKTKYEYDDKRNWTREYHFDNDETEPNFLIRRTITYKK